VTSSTLTRQKLRIPTTAMAAINKTSNPKSQSKSIGLLDCFSLLGADHQGIKLLLLLSDQFPLYVPPTQHCWSDYSAYSALSDTSTARDALRRMFDNTSSSQLVGLVSFDGGPE
jgi:hypothetical protein